MKLKKGFNQIHKNPLNKIFLTHISDFNISIFQISDFRFCFTRILMYQQD